MTVKRKKRRNERKSGKYSAISQSHKHILSSTYPVSLPYFAPRSDLPADLPTIAVIENSQDILYERTAAKVVLVSPHFIVKFGRHVNLEEGRTMKFAKECVGIPVPRVYALYGELGKNYIIMEHICGETLEDIWHTLSESEKAAISAQIKRHLQDLRAIPSPNGYCSLDNKPLRDSLLCPEGSLECDRLFNTELDLVEAIVEKYKASEALKGKAGLYAEALPSIFRNRSPVLTHGDLQRKNIVVRAESQSRMSVVFLDWESAGWYPAFWEFTQAMGACGLFKDDWNRWILEFLEPFWNEYAWMDMLQREVGY